MDIKEFYLFKPNRFFKREKIEFDYESPSFLYGFSLFETIKLKEKKIYFFREHMKRLKKGIEILDMNVSINSIEDILLKFIKRHQIIDGVIRISLYIHYNSILLILKFSPPFSKENSPLSAFMFNWDYPLNVNPLLKSGNFLAYHLSLKMALYNNCDIALILRKKEAVEFSIGNLLFEKDQKYFTPPLKVGCLNGIMRNFLLREKIVEEKTISKEILGEIDGLYLINSVRLINPVKELKGEKINLNFENPGFEEIRGKILDAISFQVF